MSLSQALAQIRRSDRRDADARRRSAATFQGAAQAFQCVAAGMGILLVLGHFIIYLVLGMRSKAGG